MWYTIYVDGRHHYNDEADFNKNNNGDDDDYVDAQIYS